MSSYSRQQLESWLKNIDVKGNCLDLGGSQNPIKGRTKSWDVSDYKILDLDQPHECKKEPDYIADLNENMFDCDDIKQMDEKYEKFDVAFCIEVFEYIYSPIRALRNIYCMLKKGGLLYISFNYFYPIHNPPFTDFLRYTPDGAVKLLEKSGFEILDHQFRYLKENESVGRMIEIINTEKMRPRKDPPVNFRIIGSLITARKK